MSIFLHKIKPYLYILSGNMVGTLLQFLLLPFITRIYSANDFSVYSIIISWSMVAYLFSTFRYDIPILQAINKNEVSNLNSICFFGSILVFFFSFFLFYFDLLSTGQESFLIFFSILASCSFLGFSIVEVLCKNLLFFEEYKSVGLIRSLITILTSLLQILLSYIFISGEGLLLSRLIAMSFAILFAFLIIKRRAGLKFYFQFSLSDVKFILRKFSSFPKVDLPSNLFNYFSSNLPFLFIPFYYGLVPEMGMYALVSRTLQAPTNLLMNSIKSVFHREISARYHLGCFQFNYLIRVLSFIFISCFPFAILMVFFGTDFFSYLFSEDWIQAGELAGYASFFFIALLLRSPIQSSFQVLNIQNVYFKLEVFDFLMKISFTFFTVFFDWTVLYWLKGFLIVSSIMSFGIVLFSLFVLRKY